MLSMARRRAVWDKDGVKALRQHLDLSQEALARQMGTRQQTISEWETGMYAPRGMSERLLSMVAERAGFVYDASGADSEGEEPGGQAAPGA
jgi:putative transcriptional regulator